MNFETSCANPNIVDAFNDYKDFLFRVATLYAGTRLVEHIDLSGSLGPSFKLAISNDFDEYYTTVRTVEQLEKSIRSGNYGQHALGLATVQLCTAFEILFDRIAGHYSISVSQTDSFEAHHSSAIEGTVKLGNKALMQIRKIHSSCAVDSLLNSDEVLIKLAAIIEARNCITHAGGVVTTEKAKNRLLAYGISSVVGRSLILKDNYLDDFLHYMLMHVRTFIDKAP
jgi:hypothetical protein